MTAMRAGAVAVAAALVLLSGRSALAQYGFIIITEAAESGQEFSELLTGSLNNNGDVAYAAVSGQAPFGAVYRVLAPGYSGADTVLIDGSDVRSATAPVLNDNGWTTYVGIDDLSTDPTPGIYLSDGVGPDPALIFATDPSAIEFVGQLAINSNAEPLVAFWHFEWSQPVGATDSIKVVAPDRSVTEVDSVTSPSALAGPAINDNGLVAYLKAPGDESLGVYLSTDPANALFSVSPNGVGLISPPSLNASGDIGVFADDNIEPSPTPAGIWAVVDTVRQFRVNLFSSQLSLAPAVNSRAILNDDDELAYIVLAPTNCCPEQTGPGCSDQACEEIVCAVDPFCCDVAWDGICVGESASLCDPCPAQAIYTGEDPDPQQLIAAGDSLDGAKIVDGTLELLDFNNCEQVLFRAGLDDNRTVLVLASSVVVCSEFDLDGDGRVGVTDFLALLAAWGSNPVGPPDFDGDGRVGISDFLALLAHWT